ncbi:hypothetical protein [Pyruvatibacter sp.]|uniref:hypothetical protein n=1 Tax=Pyruvatibacter sp. TaxID=1981328 RepID=UPI0032F00B53
MAFDRIGLIFKRTPGVLLLAAMVLLHVEFASAQSAEGVAGRYAGFAMSEGVVANLAEDNGRIIGQYTDKSGRVYTLNGQRVGEGAQGLLERDGTQAFFQLEPRPLGIQFLYIPADNTGTPDLSNAVQAALARENVDVDTLLGQAPRETSRGEVVLADGASGADLAEDYVNLAPRERELIRLFDHVQAHLAGRLCSAVVARKLDASHRAIGLALERQQAGCSAISTLRERAIESQAYDSFETRLAVQQELLTTTMACDAGQKDAATCQTAGAMNATMFEQWRRAAVIFAEVAEGGGTAEGSGAGSGPMTLRGGVGEVPTPGARPER